MTNHEKNVSNMFNSVKDTMASEPDVISEFPALAEDQAELIAGIAKIEKDHKDFITVSKGMTEDKHNSVNLAIKFGVPIKCALYSTGSKEPRNEKLIAESSVTEYELGRLNEIDFKSIMNVILDNARANAATILISHKITSDNIAAAQAALDNAVAKGGAKDSSFNDRSSLRKALTKDFDDTNNLLTERYDHDAEILRKDHIDLYNKYKAARVIKDLGGSHNSNKSTPPPTTTPAQ